MHKIQSDGLEPQNHGLNSLSRPFREFQGSQSPGPSFPDDSLEGWLIEQSGQDYYSLLDVARTATAVEIKAGYRLVAGWGGAPRRQWVEGIAASSATLHGPYRAHGVWEERGVDGFGLGGTLAPSGIARLPPLRPRLRSIRKV